MDTFNLRVKTKKVMTFCSDVKRVTDDNCDYLSHWNPAWNFCAETDRLDQTTKAGDSGLSSLIHRSEKLLKVIVINLSGAPIFAYLSDLIDRVDHVR